jgi:hypothetical protein
MAGCRLQAPGTVDRHRIARRGACAATAQWRVEAAHAGKGPCGPHECRNRPDCSRRAPGCLLLVDRPARASFGIAIGGAEGTDAAIETADIALMADDLKKLPWLAGHSKRSFAVIRRNIVLPLGVKTAFVMLFFAGLTTLWSAVAAGVGASLLVVSNALKLLRSAGLSVACPEGLEQAVDHVAAGKLHAWTLRPRYAAEGCNGPATVRARITWTRERRRVDTDRRIGQSIMDHESGIRV